MFLSGRPVEPYYIAPNDYLFLSQFIYWAILFHSKFNKAKPTSNKWEPAEIKVQKICYFLPFAFFKKLHPSPPPTLDGLSTSPPTSLTFLLSSTFLLLSLSASILCSTILFILIAIFF